MAAIECQSGVAMKNLIEIIPIDIEKDVLTCAIKMENNKKSDTFLCVTELPKKIQEC